MRLIGLGILLNKFKIQDLNLKRPTKKVGF